MAGYWFHPERKLLVRVATTHDEWVRDRANAEALGLPEAVYQEIMGYDPADIDAIRLAACRCGLVRVREHKRHVSVQYAAEAERVGMVLGAVVTALIGAGIHPDSMLHIDNLLAGDSRSVTLGGLQAELETAKR